MNLKLHLFEGISHQVVISEPSDLLLDAVFHLGLRRKGRCVVEQLLLLLDIISEQLNLSVEGFQLIFVLPRLRLELGFEQSGDRSTPVSISLLPSNLKLNCDVRNIIGKNGVSVDVHC